MTETIETPTFLVLLALIVAAWLIVGLRDRRRARRSRPAAYICGDTWHSGTVDEGVDWYICTRPYEHTGPCLDGINGVIRR